MIAWVVIDRRHFTQRASCEGFTQSGRCEGSRQANPFASAPYSFISITSFVSHLPYSLPSSVSRNSFVWHSYENCRGVCQQFPMWKIPSALERNSQPAFVFKFFLFKFLRTLLHRKTQLLPFQPIPHSLLKNTGGGVPTLSSMWPRLIASKVE